jgi:predicted membrane channel-forming protein YqfA (hemolysin III family)
MGSIPPDQAGYAGGFIATVRNLSYSLGTALSVAIYAAVLQTNIAIGSASPSLMAIQTVYRIGAILCLAGLLLSYTTHTSRKKQVKNAAWDDQS